MHSFASRRRPGPGCLVLALGWWLLLAARGHAEEAAVGTPANVMAELTFTAQNTHADPFNDVTLDVVFTTPGGRELRVPAFWDGGALWRARYAAPETGVHRYRTECSDGTDAGLIGRTGRVEVHPYTGANPSYQHGPLRVAASGRYLEHADHTPFFWLADTWWMGLTHRLHWPEEFQELTADRRAKGFNVIQIVAGLYPDMPPFDPRGANEAGFPWTTNYSTIRPEYFAAADRRLAWLVDQGFTPCIVGAWGYFLPWMGPEKMRAHWRYLIARYGAWPVVWCAAGEANLPWYLAPHFPYDDRRQTTDWTGVLRYIRTADPYHRPLTIHPTAIGQYTARHATDDAGLLDFDLLQTPHGERGAVPVAINAVRESRAATPRMPVIDGEASYEMLSDRLPTQWTRRMFWICLMNGAAGHTYGANGIWQCNRPGQPHGPSPGGSGIGYGKIPWNEAMHLPGSTQLGLGKALLTELPWSDFQPHPEWVAPAENAAPPDLTGAQWIWYPEGQPAADAPVAARYFRRELVLPADAVVTQARLCASADDGFRAWLNGVECGRGDDWHQPQQFAGLAPRLHPGINLLTLRAENRAAPVTANPAGLIARLEVRLTNGQVLRWTTDATWQSARETPANWPTPAADAPAWTNALALGPLGMGPWGQLGAPDESLQGPQATGIPGRVRVIYAPDARPIVVRHLDGEPPGGRARYMDAVSGMRGNYGPVTPDAAGSWFCPPPGQVSQDWVLILEWPVPAGTRGSKSAAGL